MPSHIPVIDFRRHGMVLQWQSADGTWTACDVPPALVHGVALIRAAQPNICLFGRNQRLRLQVGADQYELSDNSPIMKWSRGLVSLGLRSRFSVATSGGDVLFSHSYWSGQGDEFFSWVVSRAADPAWRRANGPRWSAGVEPAQLRSG